MDNYNYNYSLATYKDPKRNYWKDIALKQVEPVE